VLFALVNIEPNPIFDRLRGGCGLSTTTGSRGIFVFVSCIVEVDPDRSSSRFLRYAGIPSLTSSPELMFSIYLK
jgi:hypothetical protein